MKLADIVQSDRVDLISDGRVLTKKEALERLSELLGRGSGAPAETIFLALKRREEQQTTGIGDGVAFPHGEVDGLSQQIGAVLLVPSGVAFESVDGSASHILIALVGPVSAEAKLQHVRLLARFARVLRNSSFREALLSESTAYGAWQKLCHEDEKIGERAAARP